MRFAPEEPPVEQLAEMHPLSNEGRQKVIEQRRAASRALKFGHKLLAIIGPCAMTDDKAAILEENLRIAKFAQKNDIEILHRIPPWKPRTNPNDWHGLETTDPVTAHDITVAVAEQSGNLALEFGHIRHIRRYLAQVALGWRGSRNEEDGGLLNELIARGQSLPLAIKNGLDGTTERAAHEARLAWQQRNHPDAAPVVPVFRGGSNLRTAPEWLAGYEQAFEDTSGVFIVDAAHGGEQAHDPKGEFGKSAAGQLACLHSIITTADATNRLPRGIMIEASDIPSPTDPVIPLDKAFEALEAMAAIHRQLHGYPDEANRRDSGSSGRLGFGAAAAD